MEKIRTTIRWTPTRNSLINNLCHKLHALPSDKDWDVTVAEHKDSRSHAQNRLQWHWLNWIADTLAESGYARQSSEDLKDYFLELLGFTEVVTVETPSGTKSQTRPMRTSKMKLDEMAEWLTALDHHCGSEYGWTLPRREDDYYQALMTERAEIQQR